MTGARADILVTGHVCLDITPSLADLSGDLKRLLVPGTLVRVGPATVAEPPPVRVAEVIGYTTSPRRVTRR